MAYVGTYLALTAALFVLFHLTGRAVAGPLLPRHLAFDERLALRLAAGVATWVALLFALAALQLLRPGPIYGAIVLAVAAGVWSVWGDQRKRARGVTPSEAAPGSASPRAARGPLTVVLAAVIAIVLAALWAQALRPIVAWDADVYHLTVPRLFLEHGGFRAVALNVYSNWPLAVQLLYALAMTLKDYVLAAALHFGFGVVTVVVVDAATARASTPLWGKVAAALVLLHPVLLYEIRVAYVDVACAFLLCAAFLALHRALDQRADEVRLLLAAGIACGVLAGAKLNGFFGVLAIAAVYVGSRLRTGAPARALVRPLLALAAPVAVFGLPWLIKSWWLTGNLVYPLLYDLFGGPDWSTALGRAHRAWQRSIGMGRAPLDFLLLPFRVLFQGGEGYARFDGRLHPLAGILLPFALAAAGTAPLVRRALAVAGVWFVLWAATSQQMRFLIPVLPLLAIATAVGCWSLAARWLPRPAIAGCLAAALVALLLIQANAHYLEQAPELYAALWTRGDELRAHATDEVYAVIERELPSDAKLLFVNMNRGFFSRREYLADSFFEASQIAAMLDGMNDRDGIRRGLAARGVTHVLVERQEGGPVYPAAFVELLEAPDTRVVYRSRDGQLTLLALPSSPSAPSAAPK